jgi:hypothetical protein
MTVAGRLRTAQRRAFVGREEELELFRGALAADPPVFAVLHVHGPGGVGKSALLDAYAAIAEAAGAAVTRLDARELDRTPDGLRRAIGGAAAAGVRRAVLLDTYELLAPLDAWLRDVLLPELPASTTVVLAGRDPPGPGWWTDPGWGELFRSVALRNLRPEESRTLLERRGIRRARAEEAIGFTHGHPLALALCADVLQQGGAEGLTPERSLDVLRALVKRFTEGIPSALHRQALEVCAHARVTTEALLAAAIGPEHAHALFDWLAGLSIVERGPRGLHPHDLAREALDADLRWRNPEAYAALHRRVRAHILPRLRAAAPRDAQRAFADLLFLHRHNPVARPIYRFYELGRVAVEPARPDEAPALVAMAARLQGPEAARCLDHWIRRQPGAAWVVVDGPRRPAGLVLELWLDGPTPEDLAIDPIARRAWEHMRRRGPLREGEAATLSRLWFDADGGRALATAGAESVACVSTLHWVGVPSPAWSFVLGEPDRWGAFFEHLDFAQVPGGLAAEDGREDALFAHDWRVRPVPAWLELMSDREIDLAGPPPPAAQAAEPLVLSEPEFEEAVRQALRALHRPDLLRESPLLRSRVVLDRDDPGGPPAALQAALREAADELRADPRAAKLFRAVQRTYLEPAPTQEQAAALLRLPFSTYRRHLVAGVDRMVACLWRREVHGVERVSTK